MNAGHCNCSATSLRFSSLLRKLSFAAAKLHFDAVEIRFVLFHASYSSTQVKTLQARQKENREQLNQPWNVPIINIRHNSDYRLCVLPFPILTEFFFWYVYFYEILQTLTYIHTQTHIYIYMCVVGIFKFP